MQRNLKLQNYRITRLQIPQRGYMLITLMLALALLSIALLAVLPEIGQQVRRDREDELRHRGTAYMRAIQRYYRKLGRYPSRIEELENTNNQRFIRKRYKDPVNRDPATGKERDFKLLHQQDISLNNGPILGPIAGGPPTGPNGLGANAGAAQQPEGSDTQTDEKSDSGGASQSTGDPNAPKSLPSSSGSGFSGPTFGGGPILGVASTSKAKSIRVFYDKSHYNDWLFFYVPGLERSGLLTGPVNPSMPSGNLMPGQPPPNAGPTQTPPPSPPPPNPEQTPPEQ